MLYLCLCSSYWLIFSHNAKIPRRNTSESSYSSFPSFSFPFVHHFPLKSFKCEQIILFFLGTSVYWILPRRKNLIYEKEWSLWPGIGLCQSTYKHGEKMAWIGSNENGFTVLKLNANRTIATWKPPLRSSLLPAVILVPFRIGPRETEAWGAKLKQLLCLERPTIKCDNLP